MKGNADREFIMGGVGQAEAEIDRNEEGGRQQDVVNPLLQSIIVGVFLSLTVMFGVVSIRANESIWWLCVGLFALTSALWFHRAAALWRKNWLDMILEMVFEWEFDDLEPCERAARAARAFRKEHDRWPTTPELAQRVGISAYRLGMGLDVLLWYRGVGIIDLVVAFLLSGLVGLIGFSLHEFTKLVAPVWIVYAPFANFFLLILTLLFGTITLLVGGSHIQRLWLPNVFQQARVWRLLHELAMHRAKSRPETKQPFNIFVRKSGKGKTLDKARSRGTSPPVQVQSAEPAPRPAPDMLSDLPPTVLEQEQPVVLSSVMRQVARYASDPNVRDLLRLEKFIRRGEVEGFKREYWTSQTLLSEPVTQSWWNTKTKHLKDLDWLEKKPGAGTVLTASPDEVIRSVIHPNIPADLPTLLERMLVEQDSTPQQN